MAESQAISRADLEQKIVALAWKDQTFRKAFLDDPKKQFEEKLATKLPPNLKISARQEDDTHLYFVIPAKPKGALGELSDNDLERVAGGVDVIMTAVTAVTAVTIAASLVGTANKGLEVLSDGQMGWSGK